MIYHSPLNHQRIRNQGQEMAQQIEALPADQPPLEALDALKAASDRVDYEAIAEEFILINGALKEANQRQQALQTTIDSEIARIDSLAQYVSSPGMAPSVQAAAKKLADQKKQAVNSQYESQLEQAKRDAAELERYYQDNEETIEAIGTAWPIPESSEELVEPSESVEPAQQVVPPAPQKAETATESAELEAAQLTNNEKLSLAIPSLLERLKRVKSEHSVVYKPELSVAHAMKERHNFRYRDPRRRLTDRLAISVSNLKRRFLPDNATDKYTSYYTPDEIIGLVDRLSALEANRTNPEFFKEVEAQSRAIAGRSRYIGYDEVGYRDDWRSNTPGPAESDYQEDPFFADQEIDEDAAWDGFEETESYWEQLSEQCRQASEIIRSYMLAGGSNNTHRRHYLVNVIDTLDLDNDIQDMTDIYQFVADEYAISVIGHNRQTLARRNMASICQANIDIIDSWLAEAGGLLSQVPEDFSLKQRSNASRLSGFEGEDVKPAVKYLKEMVVIMRARANSGEVRGRLKSIKADLHAFYSLQFLIAYIVEDIKRELPSYSSQEVTLREIIPLKEADK